MSNAIRELKELVVVMTEVLTELKKLDLFNRRNLIWTGLSKFNILLKDEEVTPEDFRPYILPVYSKLRFFIKNSDDDSWMKKVDLLFWYGSDIPEVKKDGFKLLVSACYNKALEIKESHIAKLTGNPEIDRVMIDDDMMFYPSELTYYTLSVFKEFLIDSEWNDDIKDIDDYMNNIAQEIGIVKDEPRKEGFNMAGLMENLTNAAKSNGMNVPGNMPNDLNEMMGKFFGNQEIQTSMTEAMAELKSGNVSLDNPASIGTMFSNIFDKLSPHMNNMMGDPANPPEGVTDNNTMPNANPFASLGDIFKGMSGGGTNDINQMMKSAMDSMSGATSKAPVPQSTATVTDVTDSPSDTKIE